MSVPNSFIKNISIEISGDYKLTNAPFVDSNKTDEHLDYTKKVSNKKSNYFKGRKDHLKNKTDEDINDTKDEPQKNSKYFIGRKGHIRKFSKFLSDSDKGIFLVTGERGIGKTSFVNYVINEHISGDEQNRQKAERDDVEKARMQYKRWWHNVLPFRKRSIRKIKKESQKKKDAIQKIQLTLSQSRPREIDILWLMVSSMYEKFKKHTKSHPDLNTSEKWITLKYYSKIILVILASFCIALLFLIWKADIKWDLFPSSNKHGLQAIPAKIFFSNLTEANIYWTLIVSFFFFVITFIVFFIFKKKESDELKSNTAHNRIKRLVDRCNALLTEEISGEDEINNEGIIGALFGRKEKTTKKFAVATAKEIEYELKEFIEQCGEYELKFIIIFDELDKIDPVISSTYLYEDLEKFQKTENSHPGDLRDRKQAIINIIAGLKNFFTTAEARFIFIAGNEMFDAALADIADRQASVSSIFTYTFHIGSFLKEKNIGTNRNTSSLSIAIEDYLKWVIFGVQDSEENLLTLIKTLRPQNQVDHDNSIATSAGGLEVDEVLKDELPFQLAKAIVVIQNFITYLTYRSNGSPKKLIKIIHEFIVVKDKPAEWIKNEKDKVIFLNQPTRKKGGNPKSSPLLDQPNHEKDGNSKSSLFLYFNYNNQYRIGFINYLYRPFLIRHGRNFKLFSDNIIISTPYLFDHLIKFHPFAFSLSNLELIPEVVSSNKTPSLQEHLRNIIEYLGENHIRKTDVSLFDYKFYSRTFNEITYLSKLFEEEAAAFNFTLDESYLVKIYIRSKIKELRNNYSKSLGEIKQGALKHFFSISHLNGILGDLHFFDQEYDDAIVAYSDAIRPMDNHEMQELTMSEFTALFKNRLKVGLCFEKTNSYYEALSCYTDCCQDAKKFVLQKVSKRGILTNLKNHGDISFYNSSALIDLLHVIIQGFLAAIIIQEKLGVEGVTIEKLSISFGNFLKLAVLTINSKEGAKPNLIFANAFLLIGKLFYFKNETLSKELLKVYQENKQFIGRIEKLESIFLKEFSDDGNISETGSLMGAKFSEKGPSTALYMYLTGLLQISERSANSEFFYNKLLDAHDKRGIINFLLDELEQILNNDEQQFLGYHYRYIATFLSSIGDSLLCMSNYRNFDEKPFGDPSKSHKSREIYIQEIFNLPEYDPGKHSFIETINRTPENQIGRVIKCYYLSGKFFLKYGRALSCSYQYRKILYLLKTVAKNNIANLTQKFISFLEINLVRPVLELTSQNAVRSDRHMVKKIEKLFQETPDTILPFILNNISNNAETREVIIVFNYIKLKLGDIPKINRFVASVNSIATQFTRLMELEYYAKYVYELHFKKVVNNRRSKRKSENETEKKDILTGKLIDEAVNYLYSMLSMVRIQQIYGNDFLIGHSSFAYTHYRIAEFLSNFEIDQGTRELLEKFISKETYISYDAVYHYEMAKDLYRKSIELHSSGKEYKTTISQLIYLEDDYSDNAYHFGAAINRYLIINNDFDEKIKNCEKAINKDKYYNPLSYTGE